MRTPSSDFVKPKDLRWLLNRFLSVASRIGTVMTALHFFPIILSIKCGATYQLSDRDINSIVKRSKPARKERGTEW
jgi:hypothetical protein